MRAVAVIALLSLCTVHARAQSSVHDFRLGGAARVLNEECIRLTPDAQYLSGSAWFKEPIDLDAPFEMRLSVVLGKKDVLGADGIVFVFHTAPRTGFRGEAMGVGGLVPSFGIELDTYQNLHRGDPEVDHLGWLIDGDASHGRDREAASFVELHNLEDGARHPLRITWDPEGEGSLEVALDGKRVATYPGRSVRSVFGGERRVYWGMTAGTGRLSNEQDVCIERLLLSRVDLKARQGA
ncbi:MAG: hypothetical protein HC923_02905 [Myxococcales bacterium]|nr:hypothetical protein [Myxococcales bacterium]